MRSHTVAIVAAALLNVLTRCAPAAAAEFLVHDAGEFATAHNDAAPGDSIVLADGVWSNQSLTLGRNGTAAAPITLRAQTPGRVILTGSSRLTISGDHTITSGLTFKDGALTGGQVVSLTSSASFSRFTGNAIIDYDPATRDVDYEWVRVDGVQNRVDHNFFKGHDHAGITLEVFPSVDSRHQIDNNHFADRPHGTGNGWETIRVGLSSVQARSAKTLIENNLFERCDGELEIISNKTSDNIIRNNTIRASDGTMTVRHGQGTRVEGNYILGENKPGSGGIRVIGPNHVVVNNHMQDLDTNALSITTGYSDWDVDTTATGYEPVYDVVIAHNTAVNVTDQIVTRDAGYTSDPASTRNVRPRNVTMANNLFWSTHETLVQGTEGTGWTWAGNMAFGTTVGKSGSGILNVNPQMVKDANGTWRPAPASPAVNGAASGAWTPPTTDIDGQARSGALDIGADEVAGGGAAPPRGPLSGSDVGPAWLKRRTIALDDFPAPVLIMEAEHFTVRDDPNADGDTWSIVAAPNASGGFVMKAPPGTRTDVPGSPHDALLEFDLAFHDAGDYFLYALARGLDSGSDSIWIPGLLGDDPAVNRALPTNGQWGWVNLATYSVADADVNRPLTLKLGRRERDAEIDMLILSPVALNLSVPEPGGLSLLMLPLLLTSRRARR